MYKLSSGDNVLSSLITKNVVYMHFSRFFILILRSLRYDQVEK